MGETHYCFSSSQATQLDLASSAGAVVASAMPVTGNQNLFQLVVPGTLTPGNYTVKDPGSSAAAAVQLRGFGAMLLLEADKALYKPGQRVRFRAVSLSSGALKPAPRNLSFEVTSPEGFKLLKTSAETDAFGVAHFSFPIAQEPLLGRHVAQVSIDGAGAGAFAEASFGVDEYVLPRFEVTVSLDQSHLTVGSTRSATQSISGKVKANFTFGEPVVGGRCSVQLWSPLRPWEMSREASESGGTEHKAITSLTGLTLDERGEATFQFDASSNAMNPGSQVVVEATVTFPATGEQQSGRFDLPVRYQGNDLQAKLTLSDGLEVFRPGLSTRLTVQLSKPDGAAPSAEELAAAGELVLVASKNTVDYTQRPEDTRIPLAANSFDENAQQALELDMAQESLSCCDPSASRTTWEEHQQACGCCVTHVNFYVERKIAGETYFNRIYSAPDGESATACAGRAYSPSGDFLAMDTPSQAADGRWSALLRSTRAPSTSPSSIQYMLTQAGALKAAGEVSASFTASGSVYQATISMDLPASMSGDLQLLAMHSESGSPTLAASAKLSRPLELPFNLTCSFSKDEVQPGNDVAVQLQATTPAAGRAFVSSLDRSAELLGPRSAVSKSAILAALQRRGEGKEPTPVAGKVWRHCTYGEDLLVMAELDEDMKILAGTTSTGTDDAFYGEPLGPNCPRPLYDGSVCSSHGGPWDMDDMAVMAMAAEAEAAGPPGVNERAVDAADTGTAEQASASGTSAVRSFFPETWIWTDLALEPTGSSQASAGSLALQAPDTITTWTLEAFSLTADGISAARAETPLRVFKPFFVEMRLPYAAVRGEDLELIIAVFNYADAGTLTAQVKVTLPTELELVDGSVSSSLEIPEGQATRLFLRVRPKELGSWQILCSASAGSHSDAMRKPLLVKPEGIPVSRTETIVVDLTGSNSFSETKSLTLPESAVTGSARLQVNAVGDMLGPSISGLDRLLRIPTGCGEQNMITLAPNVYVAKYLKATGKMTPDQRERIINNMVVGYGRQLTYRHDDGSFSAFGKSDGSGSTWLTSFVLRVFVEVQETGLVFVDQGVLKAAVQFLMGTQRSDGSFESVGKVIHQEMLGGASGSAVALSAYVSSALAKASTVLSVDGLGSVLTRAQTYLEQQTATGYTALLRAHALSLAGLWNNEQVASEVLGLSTLQGSKRYWSSGADESTLEIEMTGYGLLALTLSERLGEAFQAAQWLLERRSASGGFSSTQDTVVALGALATYATAAGQSVDVTLQVSDEKQFQESIQINAQNADVLQQVAFPLGAAGAQSVAVSGTGSGMALVLANLQYNLPESAIQPCYTVEVEWFSTDGGDAVAAQACSSPPAGCGTEGVMAIFSVGLFTGYSASISSLQALKDAKLVKRFELNEGKVDLYLEELKSAEQTCVQFNVTKEFKVWNVQPAASTVYEYYKPERRGEALASFTMKDLDEDTAKLPGISGPPDSGRPSNERPTASAGRAAWQVGILAAIALVAP